MVESYDSVLDRIGAFNAATEGLSKNRLREVTVEVQARPELKLRLLKTAESYAIEVAGATADAAEPLAGMGFDRTGDVFSREVRKSERSWNVASQLEDVLQDALGLGSNVTITVGSV
ncbi:MAG TPA: hypothetical protein VF157_14495 [Chloroflexota bacterium]